MSNLQTPFRYDFVGSFLRPEKLKKARRQFNEGKIDAAALKKVEDEAITELVSKIKELGYHVITDGEFRRATWHLDFMWGFEGIEHQKTVEGNTTFDAEWRVSDKSMYAGTPYLYKDNGFKDREKAEELVNFLSDPLPAQGVVDSIERKKETKNPPLLYNLAEIQNECSKLFKISPDETLNIIQELYEKKLVTYPRTDARVLSTAVSKEIHKNIGGLKSYMQAKDIADEVMQSIYCRIICRRGLKRQDIATIKQSQTIMRLFRQDRALIILRLCQSQQRELMR